MNGVWSLYLHPNASLAVFFSFFLSISITQTSFHRLGRNPKAETRPPPVSKCNAFKPISCALSHCFWAARVATRCFHAVLVLSLPPRWLLNHIPTISSLGHCYHLCDLHYVRASKRTHTHTQSRLILAHMSMARVGSGGDVNRSLSWDLTCLIPFFFFPIWLSVRKACVVSGPASVRTHTNQEILRRNKNKAEYQITRTLEKTLQPPRINSCQI